MPNTDLKKENKIKILMLTSDGIKSKRLTKDGCYIDAYRKWYIYDIVLYLNIQNSVNE